MKHRITSNYPPEVALQVQRGIGVAVRGAMVVADHNPVFGKGLASDQKSIQSDLVSLTWVGREHNEKTKGYRYRIDFYAARVLQRYDFDRQGKVALIRSEAVEVQAQSD